MPNLGCSISKLLRYTRSFGLEVDWTRVTGIPTAPSFPQQMLATAAAENDIEILQATRQTVLWGEEKYLRIAPGQHSRAMSIIYGGGVISPGH